MFKMLIRYIIWMLAHLIPKNNKIWIFGAIRGEKYIDNSKYLFEYVNKNEDIQAIWLSRDMNVVNKIRKKGYSSFYFFSIKGIYYSIRAKVAIITHRGKCKDADLPYFLFSKKTKIIQLWHGIPLKKIGFDDRIFSKQFKQKNYLKKYLVDNFFPFLNYVHNPSIVIALSEVTQEIFSKAFRIDKSRVPITGYPRNDVLLENVKKEYVKNRIIYMPTFRGKIGSEFNIFDNEEDLKKVNNYLESNNLFLDIKLHPFNKVNSTFLKNINMCNNISFLDKDLEYEKLSDYYILVTDYSSIFFDFLLLDRPIIFAPFDIELYRKNDRDLYFEYDLYTPGPKAKNWTEVIKYIEDSISNPNQYKKIRQEVLEKFHFYQDNNSSKRVIDEIKKII